MVSSAFSTHLAVSTGPAGRAMAQPMEASLVESLQQHLNMERSTSVAYDAMAIWSAERELRGFAGHFRQEARGELSHAGRFADYLIARGLSPQLQSLPAPRQDWASLEEILAAAFLMEADVTASLQQLYGLAERASDVRTSTFLDPIIDAQVRAEHEAAHLLGRVRFAQGQPAAVLIIDGELTADKAAPATLA